MNFFKKLVQRLRQKKTLDEMVAVSVQKEENAPSEAGMVRVLLEMQHNTVYPAHLLQPLCMAIAMDTGLPAHATTDDIKLYSLYDLENESFLGSFYALKKDGVYYGYIVGQSEIISCGMDTFRFVETEELIVPLRKEGDALLVLECKYEAKKSRLTALSLKKQDVSQQNTEVLHQFEKQTSFEEAYSYWRKEFAKE